MWMLVKKARFNPEAILPSKQPKVKSGLNRVSAGHGMVKVLHLTEPPSMRNLPSARSNDVILSDAKDPHRRARSCEQD
jgi:hypothetical protein